MSKILIFEPRDGGDTCYELAGVRLVEQYKTFSQGECHRCNVISGDCAPA